MASKFDPATLPNYLLSWLKIKMRLLFVLHVLFDGFFLVEKKMNVQMRFSEELNFVQEFLQPI